jgi:hypothetical protein
MRCATLRAKYAWEGLAFLASQLSLTENVSTKNFQHQRTLRPYDLPLDQIAMAAPYTPKEDLTDTREANVLAEFYEMLESRPTDVGLHETIIEGWLSIGETGNPELITHKQPVSAMLTMAL